ncbi:MAG TPA: VOC family protein [Actinomycetota bacterium]
MRPQPDPVVHIELRTNDVERARIFLGRLFGWNSERIRVGGRQYLALDVGDRVEGGIAARDGDPPAWLPYVEVADVDEAAERARALGASVVLPPTEGPAGWHAILGMPAGGEVGLWQPKR